MERTQSKQVKAPSEAERVGANESDKRRKGADAAEGHGAGVDEHFTGSSGAGAHRAAGHKGANEPGIGSPKFIIG